MPILEVMDIEVTALVSARAILHQFRWIWVNFMTSKAAGSIQPKISGFGTCRKEQISRLRLNGRVVKKYGQPHFG